MRFLIFLLLLFVQCFASFSNRKLVYATKDTAFYLLKKEDIANSDLLTQAFLHPYKVEAKKLKDILSGIRYIRSTSMGDYDDFLFSEEELDNISKDLINVIHNLKDDETAVVISKYDPIKSVISVHKRTSFIVWFDASGMNLVFGEIQKVISRDKVRSQYDWTIIPEINIKSSNTGYARLNENDRQFKFKLINGFPNKRWIVFDMTKLGMYKFKKRSSIKPKKVDQSGQN
ncbi:MAG: hypothetical protein H7A23_12595 [Leptospiraceae bacterium]|nr:hypothetical protein [Leptospiraceae bacterium]